MSLSTVLEVPSMALDFLNMGSGAVHKAAEWAKAITKPADAYKEYSGKTPDWIRGISPQLKGLCFLDNLFGVTVAAAETRDLVKTWAKKSNLEVTNKLSLIAVQSIGFAGALQELKLIGFDALSKITAQVPVVGEKVAAMSGIKSVIQLPLSVMYGTNILLSARKLTAVDPSRAKVDRKIQDWKDVKDGSYDEAKAKARLAKGIELYVEPKCLAALKAEVEAKYKDKSPEEKEAVYGRFFDRKIEKWENKAENKERSKIKIITAIAVDALKLVGGAAILAATAVLVLSLSKPFLVATAVVGAVAALAKVGKTFHDTLIDKSLKSVDKVKVASAA